MKIEDMVGMRVRKKSDKPFLSGLKVNTVVGIVDHPYLTGTTGFIFEEDESIVATRICRVVLE